jgi:hypothetical protein
MVLVKTTTPVGIGVNAFNSALKICKIYTPLLNSAASLNEK